jgi:AraC-like DNA-binding protein
MNEILILCLHHLSRGEYRAQNEIPLSRTDLEGLNEAKKILDASISQPLFIRNLSRMVGLNEYKLKKGFSQLYGVPVHAYLIERRMETARKLLEKRNLTVSETAEYVGYSGPSSFSKAFRKKFGFNPSDCY